jgi:hypothetical protein
MWDAADPFGAGTFRYGASRLIQRGNGEWGLYARQAHYPAHPVVDERVGVVLLLTFPAEGTTLVKVPGVLRYRLDTPEGSLDVQARRCGCGDPMKAFRP